jgi:hypothetical protein
MQKSFLEDSAQEVLEEKKQEEVKKSCSFHRWANRDTDFIEVIIKKTGNKIVRCRHCETEKMENKKARLMEWKKEKENVTDYYVRKTLRTGKSGIKNQEIPQELIEAKRAIIQINNLKKKMEEPLKTCSEHGKLFREEVIRSGKYANGEQKWKCKRCMKEMHDKHYQLNKAKVLAAHAKYRKADPEKVKVCKQKSRLKHREINLQKSRELWQKWEERNPEEVKQAKKKFIQDSRRELNDYYIKQSIVKRTGLKSADVPQGLVEAKRAIMLLKNGAKKRLDQEKILLLKEKRSVED